MAREPINFGRLFFALFFGYREKEEIDEAWEGLTPEQRQNYDESMSKVLEAYHNTAAPFTIEDRIAAVETKAEELAVEAISAEHDCEKHLAHQLRTNLTHLRHRMAGASEHVCRLSDSARHFERGIRHEKLEF